MRHWFESLSCMDSVGGWVVCACAWVGGWVGGWGSVLAAGRQLPKGVRETAWSWLLCSIGCSRSKVYPPGHSAPSPLNFKIYMYELSAQHAYENVPAVGWAQHDETYIAYQHVSALMLPAPLPTCACAACAHMRPN